jgi:hypothetical protein
MPIETTSDIPTNMKQFRLPGRQSDEIQETVDVLHKSSIVEESLSPYDSPAFLRKKANGKKRLIHDFRAINLLIVSMVFPTSFIHFRSFGRFSYILFSRSSGRIFSMLSVLQPSTTSILGVPKGLKLVLPGSACA